MSAQNELVISATSPDHAFGYLGNVILYNWRRNTTSEGARALSDLTSAVRAGGNQRILAFGAVEAGAPMPPVAVRDEISKVMAQSWAGVIVASALSFEGTGFQASAVRGVATGLALIARSPFPHKVFGSASEAATWLVARASDTGTPAPSLPALIDAMKKLRAG
ncbi:MAG: hypothetical protein WCJ30_21155 [Deltaproteobacteria bacterium]